MSMTEPHTIAALREALEWALRHLDYLVSIDHEDGSAWVKRKTTSVELAGYVQRYNQTRSLLAGITVPPSQEPETK